MNQLIENIEKWVKDKKIDTLSPSKQYYKIVEELGELARGLLNKDDLLIKDSIGDIYIAFVGWCLQNGLTYYNRFEKRSENKYPTPSLFMILSSSIGQINTKGLYVPTFLDELCISLNITMEECLELAYNEVKNRDIKIVEGVAKK